MILYKNNKMSKLKSSDDVNGSQVFVYFSEVLENGEFQIKRTEMAFKNKEEEETFFKETDDPFIKIDKNEPLTVMKKKIKEISPKCFFPSPRVKSTILLIEPKTDFFEIKNPKNLEYITNIFFNQRRKMIKKPLSILFKNKDEISKKLKLNLNLRPQNLSPLVYFKLCKEYENLLN